MTCDVLYFYDVNNPFQLLSLFLDDDDSFTLFGGQRKKNRPFTQKWQLFQM